MAERLNAAVLKCRVLWGENDSDDYAKVGFNRHSDCACRLRQVFDVVACLGNADDAAGP